MEVANTPAYYNTTTITVVKMEQRTSKNVDNDLNANIYFLLRDIW
jgi:hypothetical protein